MQWQCNASMHWLLWWWQFLEEEAMFYPRPISDHCSDNIRSRAELVPVVTSAVIGWYLGTCDLCYVNKYGCCCWDDARVSPGFITGSITLVPDLSWALGQPPARRSVWLLAATMTEVNPFVEIFQNVSEEANTEMPRELFLEEVEMNLSTTTESVKMSV